MFRFISLPAFEFVIFGLKQEFAEFEKVENVPIPDAQAIVDESKCLIQEQLYTSDCVYDEKIRSVP
jgi:hypothetical protein